MTAAAVGGRDAELLRALHDQHAHALWSYVVGLTNGDRGRAQDVVQETLLRAWRNPAVLEQTGGSGRSWLFTVAKRIVIDEWRSARRRPEVVDRPGSRAGGREDTATADRRPAPGAGSTTNAVDRTPAGAARVLLPRRIGGRGRRDPRRATRHHQVPHPLRASRAATGTRADGRRARDDIDPFEHDDAAYVLDALSEPERETFEAHLATCAACTVRVNTLAATSTLLADLTADDLAEPDPQPDTLLPGLLRRAASSRRRQRWLISGLSGLAAACLIALAVTVWPTSHPAASTGTAGTVRADGQPGARHRRSGQAEMGNPDQPGLPGHRLRRRIGPDSPTAYKSSTAQAPPTTWEPGPSNPALTPHSPAAPHSPATKSAASR